MFAKALKGQNIDELLSNIGSSAPAAVATGPVVEAKADTKKEASTFPFVSYLRL